MGNEIVDVRDGFYIQSSGHGAVTRQHRARPALRPPLHVLRRQPCSRTTSSRTAPPAPRSCTRSGSSSAATASCTTAGSRRSACSSRRARTSLAEDNLIADNARGIFLEGRIATCSARNVIARVGRGGRALRLRRAGTGSRATASSGTSRRSTLVGRRTDTRFDGNYWSDNDEPDLDGDGDQRPALSSGERLRSPPREPVGGRPHGPRASRRRPSARPSGRSRSSRAVPVEDARPLARPPARAPMPATRDAGRASGSGADGRRRSRASARASRSSPGAAGPAGGGR